MIRASSVPYSDPGSHRAVRRNSTAIVDRAMRLAVTPFIAGALLLFNDGTRTLHVSVKAPKVAEGA